MTSANNGASDATDVHRNRDPTKDNSTKEAEAGAGELTLETPPPTTTTSERHVVNPTISSPPPHDETAQPAAPEPRQWRSSIPPALLQIKHFLIRIVIYIPPHARWDPAQPPQFSYKLNILFAFAAGFTVANLYYNHPILNVLAGDFGVGYEKVAQIPTVMQAGYAAGLVFLCPLGDLVRRRGFVVGLVGGTGVLWIGLCITTSLPVFTALSFLCAITTVTPQLMLPLVGDLAPPHRRATSLSIVVSGLVLGVLIARVLSGTMTNFVPWRSVYWMALGLQSTIFILLWLFMPDYPSTNPSGLNYFKMLWSILVMLTRHPVLLQACLTGLCTSATFTGFWTTLTFLLAGPPYHYSPLTIGLFGLIGILAIFFTPLYARLVTDKFVPHLSVLVGLSLSLTGICLGTYLGSFTIAGPIAQAFLLDFGMQTAQIANRSAIYGIEPKARNRVNTAFMVFTFCGQLIGTAVGNAVYARRGWTGSGSVSVAFIGCAFGVMCLKGPWEKRWIGWAGGWSMLKKEKNSADGRTVEVPQYAGVGDKGNSDRDRDGDGDRDVELGAEGKMVAEMAARDGDESPLKEAGSTHEEENGSEKSRPSAEDTITPLNS